MSEVNWSLRMLLPIIDSEAKKLNGDFSKIYIFGYSQGGMMAIWTALISDRPLGGVLVYAGCLPVLEADRVSKLGQNVPIVHLHDPRDSGVRYAHAQRGYELANKIGAHGYRPIVNFEVSGDSHHGLSAGSLAVANKYLTDMMTR
jgi:predicted esterase